MCGIFGYVLNKHLDEDLSLLDKELTDSLKHRGPDDNGIYRKGKVAIANTRLSIIDLSTGHQPVYDRNEEIVLVQNGEIYNYLEIKKELVDLGHQFTTTSDTEVLLIAYKEWGHDFVQRINGMFAIAILDTKKAKLFIYRDRLGVKPLYLYSKGDDFLFSSEIKSFLKFSRFDKTIRQQSIYDYLVYNYVPLPSTIFEHVNHLMPGSYVSVDLPSGNLEFIKYWDIDQIEEKQPISESDLITEIEDLFEDAVKIRLRSDVEVGAFLSGGLDSSMVTAYMRKLSGDKPISTHTIGFYEKEFDESIYAKNVSNQYGLINHLHFLEGNIIDYWDKVTYHNDQPHGDISFIPTFILSEYAAKDLKVVLTGDGGDELFAGYLKYQELEKNGDLDKYFENTSVFSEGQLIDVLSGSFKNEIDPKNPKRIFNKTISKVKDKDLVNKVLYFETKQLLPGNNLVKPDKMAMANSLETRSPFMDYRLFELAAGIPSSLKLKNGDTKYILKKMALKHFDKDHVYRKKQMFTVPVGEWFKNKLSDYLMTMIHSDELASRGIWNIDALQQMAEEHTTGKSNYTRQLRAIVNLELWFRNFID